MPVRVREGEIVRIVVGTLVVIMLVVVLVGVVLTGLLRRGGRLMLVDVPVLLHVRLCRTVQMIMGVTMCVGRIIRMVVRTLFLADARLEAGQRDQIGRAHV